jgi:Tfp pilus assembly protein PilF
LLAAGKKDEAISALNQQLGGSQNELFAKFLLGGIYGRDGDETKAVSYLQDVLESKPDSVVAWASLAGVYKDRAQRIAVYEKAVKAVPGSGELNMLLASEYEQGGQGDKAIVVYEGMLKKNPGYEPAVNNLAALLLDQRTDKASHARALKLAAVLARSENPAMLDTLGWAHYRNGQYAEAVSVLERVVAKAGQFPVFRYHLGMAYLNAGNPVGAKQELEAAVKDVASDYPGIAEARRALAKLKQDS